MRKLGFFGFVLLVSCYNKPFYQEPIDLVFRVKSTSNVDYQISEIYPNTPRSKNIKIDSLGAYYPNFDINKFKIVGRGWDNPLPNNTDPTNTEHNKANRRTEVKVYPLEQ